MQLPFNLGNSNDVWSVALESLKIQETSKGSDQTKRMRRLVWKSHVVAHMDPYS